MVDSFHILAMTPTGMPNPSLAIAASRAGEVGVLNLEYAETQVAARAVAKLQRFGNHDNCGIKLNCEQYELLTDLLADNDQSIGLVVLTGSYSPMLPDCVRLSREKKLTVLVEVTNYNEARLAETLEIDGIIAKGNEAGGRVGEETTFVLLQSLLAHSALPVFAHGGIGLHTAAACFVAGAAGIVLDSQLLLTKESPLTQAVKMRLEKMDGSETLCLGSEIGAPYRFYAGTGATVLSELQMILAEQIAAAHGNETKKARWSSAIAAHTGWSNDSNQIWILGQDIALARSMAEPSVTVAEVIARIHQAIEQHTQIVCRSSPMTEGSPLSLAHNTRYPIVQGPMTRVSDNADFALAVAEAGALPFVALALLRGDDASALLQDVNEKLAGYSWGVGILGFVPQELRAEQLELIRTIQPNYALIAGGRPDQAAALEREGISTYLHVPSPGLLQMFLADGAQRLVFEGRECGGHVGPRTSFVLWDTMVDILLAHLRNEPVDGHNYHILFAGGIHDGLSAAMVSALAAPLVEQGAKIGVLMGTAYIFTHEAVTSGAIVPRYQAEAQRSGSTVLLETGPGHVTRCLDTPFVQAFNHKKQTLIQERREPVLVRRELEDLNLGRLRMASKGITRHERFGKDPDVPKYVTLSEDQQYEDGMYMIGQIAGLRDQVCSMEELHQAIVRDSAIRLQAVAKWTTIETNGTAPQIGGKPSQIAIVGMACILPGATNLQTYWQNILNKVDSITEIPPERFDWQRYYDADQNKRDHIYSRWGGFIDEVPFDPLNYGMPPNSITSIEPMQLLMLEVVHAALADAGYLTRDFARENTSVIMAVGGGLGDLGFHYSFRTYLPHFLDADRPFMEHANRALPEWTEDSFPGILLNVLAGRVANRFDLGGPNFVVDAACGSSLAALDVAVKDLELHRTDMSIVGAADTMQSPFGFMAFSKTQALSPTGRCRPFDVNANGIAISEGLAVVVLKRLDDAVRDGDTVYAVIQGIGSSSDGKDRSLTAPRPEGQLRALQRAYEKAGFAPSTVSLIEAHGTGTRVGDVVEVEALETLMQRSEAMPVECAIGSVKSMIGHTKSTAGLAGLIKVALALYHKTLPPTLVETPNPKFGGADTPFYVNTEPRPWFVNEPATVRRAGVSAFGFGGTNFHAVLEEFQGAYLSSADEHNPWPSELVLIADRDRAVLLAQINAIIRWLDSGNRPPLRDLAYTLYRRYRQHVAANSDHDGPRLALVADTLEDLRQKLSEAVSYIQDGEENCRKPWGIYFVLEPRGKDAKIAFLFPGQGSQYPNMLRDLLRIFPSMYAAVEHADQMLSCTLSRPLNSYIFPRPTHSEAESKAVQAALTDTQIAQPALGAICMAVGDLLRTIGIEPTTVAGHSYGELVALCYSGAMTRDDLFTLSSARGRFMAEAAGPATGKMAAVQASSDHVADLIGSFPDVVLANLNSPKQTVISGPAAAVEEVAQLCTSSGIGIRLLPVASAFHSPMIAGAQQQFAQLLNAVDFHPPQVTVYSNVTGDIYPSSPEAIRELIGIHLANPVNFQQQIEAMFQAGVHLFLEVGPGRVLSGLVDQILGERPHIAASISSGTLELTSFLNTLGQVAAEGITLELDQCFDARKAKLLDLSTTYVDPDCVKFTPTTWLINGGRARPWQGEKTSVTPPSNTRTPAHFAKESKSTQSPQKPHFPDEPLSIAASPSTETSESRASYGSKRRAVQQRAVPGSRGLHDRVMLQHQHMLRQFLASHTGVMEAYLGSRLSLAKGTALPATKVISPNSPATSVHRYLLTPTASSLVGIPAKLPLERLILITDDDQGLATQVASTLRARGHQVVLLASTSAMHGDDQTPRFVVDFRDAEALHAVFTELRQQYGLVGSLVHLAPLRQRNEVTPTVSNWQQVWHEELVGLLHLIQNLQSNLANSPLTEGLCVLAATQMGGMFGDKQDSVLTSLQGGIAGILKTLAHESSACRVKVVDLNPDHPLHVRAHAVLHELTATDGKVEVGYDGLERYTLQLSAAEVSGSEPPGVTVNEESVILITGGARGISAQVARTLARQFRPRIVLVGRSPFPEEEPQDTAGLTNMAEIKAALVARKKRSGVRVELSESEADYRRLIAAREIRANLNALQECGAEVYYHSVDVRNADEFGRLIDAIYAQFGRLDGVIHGAGIVEDKLLQDKTADSLKRVVSTKIDSAYILCQHLRPDTLQFIAFFSSVSGRFGNRGQGDYAAANEVLNKLALYLDRQWPGRVVSINWGPWDGGGMVSDGVRRQFAQKGINLIPPSIGCEKFLQEILFGRNGVAEVVIADGSIGAWIIE